MGFDVTYHPITPEEMGRWFFERLSEAQASDFEGARRIASEEGIDEKQSAAWMTVITQAASWNDPKAAFEPYYGYALAAAQTFFASYWYTRGSSFTLLAEEHPGFVRYLEALPASQIAHFPPNPSNPRITANWQSGAWMPHKHVCELLANIQSDPATQEQFETLFGPQKNVILAALRFAENTGRGLLEATDVIEPNPLDISATTSVGSLSKLDPSGLLLYREEATKQLKEAGLL